MNAARDELCGDLSVSEAARADPHESIEYAQYREQIRSHYDLMLKLARQARERLASALCRGLPRFAPVGDAAGGVCGMAAMRHAAIFRLVNAFAWANRALWGAADALCEVEGYENDGAGEGVVWEVSL